jgi:hypothetical protein
MVFPKRRNHPHSVTLRVPPLPLPGGEEHSLEERRRCGSAFPLPRAGGEVARRAGVGVLPWELPSVLPWALALPRQANTHRGVHHG